jgi:hypothetical protein
MTGRVVLAALIALLLFLPSLPQASLQACCWW